jgi:hypothetical protein
VYRLSSKMILEIWAYERFCFYRNRQKEKVSNAAL